MRNYKSVRCIAGDESGVKSGDEKSEVGEEDDGRERKEKISKSQQFAGSTTVVQLKRLVKIC